MKAFKFRFSKHSREFEICQDINGNDDLVSIFEIHLNGSHFEYLYKDNATGIYTSTPGSLLTPDEIMEMGKRVEEELNKNGG